MSAPKPSRLLSLLSLVENALQRDAIESGTPPLSVSRLVNYPKGLARLMINHGAGTIFFQHFDLADGETCVHTTVTWLGHEQTGHAEIYPQGDAFDWSRAAARVAAVWTAGPKAPEVEHIGQAARSEPVEAEALKSTG